MSRRAFVLLSGGMDSTTCLFKAIYDYAPSIDREELANIIGCKIDGLNSGSPADIDWVEAISVDYGQRHKKEFTFAKATCERLGIKHTLLNIKGILDGEGVMLTDVQVEVPNISYGDIKGVSPTYVPFRNGTLLSMITAYAQKWVNTQIEAQVEQQYSRTTMTPQDRSELTNKFTNSMRDSVGIYFGAHSEDAQGWAYPDCTPEFIGAMGNAIYTGSYYTIRLHTPLQWMMKSEIVEFGSTLEVPFEQTWSCYKGEELHCGTCPTCRSRKDAFRIANAYDPTKYAV